MKTKILCLLASLVLVVAMLASCLGDGGGNEGGDENEPVDESGITYNYNWSETTITAQLNMDDNNQELSSGTRRYYAGKDATQSSDIDKSIRNRNKFAEAAANVKVEYTYLEDDLGYTWGGSIDDISTETKSGGSGCDIYCNFAYDMTAAALKGCFANLLNEDYANGNYFRFTDDDYDPTSDNYFDAEAGEGYFYQYMESLSLTPDSRIYCLASNYCTDMVRSFLVIPVNVQMMNGLNAAAVANIIEAGGDGDLNDDGSVDVLDFYEYVWDGNWTYDTLAKYSKLVYQNVNAANAGEDVGDKLGFCLGTQSGLSASGILYTSSVKIITKNATTGAYEYPQTNEGLDALVSALYDLMQTDGVTYASASDFNTALGHTPASDLVGIRERFAENMILFGGIIAVGSLEDTVYQQMREGLGFGVVPVPTYKQGDEYLTLVHNIARIVGISVSSAKFSQCSAFLDYVSRTSADILDQYYNTQLTAATGGVAGENNAEMLTYIRNHVRDCFDKTCEDLIAENMLSNDKDAYKYRWHQIITDQKYQMTDFRTQYAGNYGKKVSYLQDLLNTWNGLQ